MNNDAKAFYETKTKEEVGSKSSHFVERGQNYKEARISSLGERIVGIRTIFKIFDESIRKISRRYFSEYSVEISRQSCFFGRPLSIRTSVACHLGGDKRPGN